jgi:hypothetical protein
MVSGGSQVDNQLTGVNTCRDLGPFGWSVTPRAKAVPRLYHSTYFLPGRHGFVAAAALIMPCR